MIISSLIISNSVIKASERSNTKMDTYILAIEESEKENEKEVFDEYEAADYLGIEINRFKDLIQYDAMPNHTKIGEDYFFSKQSIINWLDNSRTIAN